MAEHDAAFSEQSRWSTNLPAGSLRGVEMDDIISYRDVVTAEKASLRNGINYGIGKDYSVFLVSLRETALLGDARDDQVLLCAEGLFDKIHQMIGKAALPPLFQSVTANLGARL